MEFLSLCSGERVSYLIQKGWLGSRETVNVYRRLNTPRLDRLMAGALFLVKIRAGEKCMSVLGTRVISVQTVCLRGTFRYLGVQA